jgi:hypothetical protein
MFREPWIHSDYPTKFGWRVRGNFYGTVQNDLKDHKARAQGRDYQSGSFQTSVREVHRKTSLSINVFS